jgi:hypothetical protein
MGQKAPAQNILENESTEITDMRVIVNSRPAAVYPDLGRIKRLELFPGAGKRIKEVKITHILS